MSVVIPDAALRGIEDAVRSILAARHPGTRWKPERPERDTLAAAGKIVRPLARIDRDQPLLTTKLTVAPLTSWPIEASGRWRSTVPARRLECTRLTEPSEYPASRIRAFATLS